MNAIAGGGSLLTFPALVFTGVPAVIANASSTVALFPGAFASAWGYRKDFTSFEGVSFRSIVIVSFVGGGVGALLLLYTPEKTFDITVGAGVPVVDWVAMSPDCNTGYFTERTEAKVYRVNMMTQMLDGTVDVLLGAAMPPNPHGLTMRRIP